MNLPVFLTLFISVSQVMTLPVGLSDQIYIKPEGSPRRFEDWTESRGISGQELVFIGPNDVDDGIEMNSYRGNGYGLFRRNRRNGGQLLAKCRQQKPFLSALICRHLVQN
ncbi:uncharacterized protein LOC132714813 [Ruditapes philippinarum]|uniref:uncharacterized protein LOC132714813 n=1 Tax=Ruditapes philippinarum TaxID=129788 RepID=UPI00295BDBEB|nr:uncharacterized protein LOC132714813 [Ruditapes philippinarum]